MRIDVFTLVPHAYAWLTEQRPVAGVLGGELELRLFNYRDSTPLRAGQVDDEPYGGGAGMVLRVDVVAAALEAAYGGEPPGPVIALTPKGRPLTQAVVEELAALPALTLLSSRFEGFDERIVDHLATDAISVGPYVLSNGDLPAMVVLDAVARRLPGRARRGLGRARELLRRARRGARVSALHAAGGVQRLAGPGRAALRRPRARRGLAAGAGEMSDDWGSYRSGLGDEDEEKDDADPGRDDPGGWPDDEPGAGKTHWPEDKPEPNQESESDWPTSGSTWQRPGYGDTSSGWERPEYERGEYGDYGRYGYLRDGAVPRRRRRAGAVSPHGTAAIRSPASFRASRAVSGSRSTGSSPSPARS